MTHSSRQRRAWLNESEGNHGHYHLRRASLDFRTHTEHRLRFLTCTVVVPMIVAVLVSTVYGHELYMSEKVKTVSTPF